MVNKDNLIVVELYVNDNKEFFDKLFDKKEEIEVELGFDMVWDRLDGKKASRIKYCIYGLDFDNHENYNELMNEIIEKVVTIRKVFKKYI